MDLNSNHSQTPSGVFLKSVFLFEWSQLKQLPHSILIINLLMFFIIGCEKQSQPTSTKANQGTLERFTDVTTKTKIAFTHQTGDPTDYFMPLDMGSGLALMDYNLDGLLDIYLLQNAGPGSNIKNQLFKQ